MLRLGKFGKVKSIGAQIGLQGDTKAIQGLKIFLSVIGLNQKFCHGTNPSVTTPNPINGRQSPNPLLEKSKKKKLGLSFAKPSLVNANKLTSYPYCQLANHSNLSCHFRLVL